MLRILSVSIGNTFVARINLAMFDIATGSTRLDIIMPFDF